MKQVLFIDPVCPKEYSRLSLIEGGLGGTEATVVRVAHGLSGLRQHEITVEQHCRVTPSGESVKFSPPNTATKADYVVVLRDPRALVEARKRFPTARLFLWAHDLCSPAFGQSVQYIWETGASLICVSNWHLGHMRDQLRAYGFQGQFPSQYIYNPVESELPAGTGYDKNQLAFVSSPHKGLKHTLELFRCLRRVNPDFKLYVSNPGYLPDLAAPEEGVIYLGSLPHQKVLELLRNSLCLFYPNTLFPETFGLVMAEANSVGTPVLTHPIGAASEIVDLPGYELTDCNRIPEVVNRIMRWYNGERPTVRKRAEFDTYCVSKQWLRLFK